MKDGECILVGMLDGKWQKYLEIDRRVYSQDGISPTIRTLCGGGEASESGNEVQNPKVHTEGMLEADGL